MIDFTGSKEKNKAYSGANGSKICILYNDDQYMLKFPSLANLKKELSYSNSVISEYLACHILESLSIPVQETLLGTYQYKGKEKLVVACKDFAINGWVIQDFASLKNRIIDSERKGFGTELNSILETINEQNIMDPKMLSNYFWDLFIADALIGNWDRHNGNWGFLYNESTDQIKLAPVWDCGSSLLPQADEKIMNAVLTTPKELNFRVYNIPLSAILIDGKKINYFDFISSLSNKECTEALKRIVPRIDLNKINSIIDGIECIPELQKNFYKAILRARKEKILDYSLKKELKIEQNKTKETISNRKLKDRIQMAKEKGGSQRDKDHSFSKNKDDITR